MKMKLTTVIVNIPAYNEEADITFLLYSLLLQIQDGWHLNKIVVLSDGSNDYTNYCVKRFYSDLITLRKGKTRQGKTYRVNEAFKRSDSDIVITLDADIRLQSPFTLNNLIKPMLTNKKLQYVSGVANPDKAKNFVQTVIRHGALLWQDLRQSKGRNSVYLSEGRIRAFRKDLYKNMRFPLTSAEDVYPYLYCKQYKLKCKVANKAIVYYKLPMTFTDYVKQMRRFLKSKAIHSSNFPKKIIEKEYSIEFKDKLLYFGKVFVRTPIKTFLYGVFLIAPKILNYLDIISHFKVKPKWDISTSSK